MCISLRSERASDRSGHSGGPALNARGEVIGWAVKSFSDLGPNGQLRPVEQLEAAVGRVLDKLVLPRPADSNVRNRLQGQLRAGTYCMGEGARAEQSADDARQGATAAASSAENAHHHEQGALAHALFSASCRDRAASEASAAAEHAAEAGVSASQAKGAAASAESSAAEAATTAVSRGCSSMAHKAAILARTYVITPHAG